MAELHLRNAKDLPSAVRLGGGSHLSQPPGVSQYRAIATNARVSITRRRISTWLSHSKSKGIGNQPSTSIDEVWNWGTQKPKNTLITW
jgi:hypothetical protein